MLPTTRPPRYGVQEQVTDGDALDQAREALGLVGYAVLDSGLSHAAQEVTAASFERLLAEQTQRYGRDRLEAIDEHNTIRAPLTRSDAFLDLALNARLHALCRRIFVSAYIVNQQNGIVNPPRQRYNQGAWHRDLPYQHFVTSRPIAINALYCIDDFTLANGCTLVVPGSHKQEAFPSDDTLMRLETPVEAPAGSFLVLDCMTFHRGGANRTEKPRRAVNHVLSLPFVKQQIRLQSAFGDRDFSPEIRRLLDFDNDAVSDADAYLARRQARLSR